MASVPEGYGPETSNPAELLGSCSEKNANEKKKKQRLKKCENAKNANAAECGAANCTKEENKKNVNCMNADCDAAANVADAVDAEGATTRNWNCAHPPPAPPAE